MKELTISANEAGQRFDKLLAKYLKEASKGFIYKMLRKKNITLNGKKADGSERLCEGDTVRLFLSDETIEKFAAMDKDEKDLLWVGAYADKGKFMPPFEIVYEDEHILVADKPAGMLSQKAYKEDTSFVEYLKEYLLSEGAVTAEQLHTFSPGICNRLDRNTSGLLVAGKTLAGVQQMNAMFRERNLQKHYLCIVKGRLNNRERVVGYLTKDANHNRVTVTGKAIEGSRYIQTEYEPLAVNLWKGQEYTLLKVHLITGKSHQIRAHLKSIGHPIIGDGKYGHKDVAQIVKSEFNLRHQLLHAYQLRFGEIKGDLSYLSGKLFEAPVPKQFADIIEAMGLQTKSVKTWKG